MAARRSVVVTGASTGIGRACVKDLMERDRLPGTLVLWPGVAEELLGGKAYMVRAGLFKDIDVVLYTHVGDTFSTGWGQPTGTGLVSRRSSRHPASSARTGPSRTMITWSGRTVWSWTALRNARRR